MLFSGYTLLRDPHFNKGLAFTEDERDAHYLRGLLPPSVIPQETQVNYLTRNYSEYFNFFIFCHMLDSLLVRIFIFLTILLFKKEFRTKFKIKNT